MITHYQYPITQYPISICLATILLLASSSIGQEKITYDDHVKPLFQQRCSSCHNPNKKSADLDVTNYTSLMQGGASGPVIEPGDASGSYLNMLITHEETPIMPPGENSKLPEKQLSLIAKWIDAGALENKGSKAKIKPKMEIASSGPATKRPDVVAVPPRMVLDPLVRTPRATAVAAIATSPWAPVAALSAEKQILLYNTQSHELMGVLPFPEGQANVLRFSRNGSLLIAAGGRHGAGAKVFVYDVKNGKRITEVADEIDTILAADISNDHTKIAIGGPQKMIRVFNTADGEKLYEIKKHTDWVTALEFSPDGVLLATGDRNGGLHVWEAETGNEYLTLKAHSKMISDISWRHDANVVGSASEDTTIRLWEVENGKQIKGWGAHGGGVTSMDFTRDGKLVSSGRDKVAKIWQQDGKMVRQFAGLPDQAMAVAFCNESGKVICSEWSGINRIWNAADGAHLADLDANPPYLKERLASAQAKLGEVQTKHKPLVDQLNKLTQQITQIDSAMNANQQNRSQAEAKLNDATTKIQVAQQQLKATLTEQQSWQKELGEKNKANPLIKQSVTKAMEALALLPNDKQLQAARDSLNQTSAALDARIKQLTQMVSQSTQKKTSTETQIQTLTQSSQVAKSEMDAATKQIQQLEAQKAPLVQQRTEQQKQVDNMSQQVSLWQSAVSRWQGEIAFANQLNELNKQLQSAAVAVSQKDDLLRETEQKLAELQKLVATQRANKQSAEQHEQQIQTKIRELQKIH